MYKHYRINGWVHTFGVICEDHYNGNVYYLAVDTKTNEEAWLASNSVSYTKDHKILPAVEVSEIQFDPYQYVWGGEIRDKRSNSMCPRPFFRR